MRNKAIHRNAAMCACLLPATRTAASLLVALLLSMTLAAPAFASGWDAPASNDDYSDAALIQSHEEALQQEKEAEETQMAEQAKQREEENAKALAQMGKGFGIGRATFDETAVQNARESAEQAKAAETARQETERQAALETERAEETSNLINRLIIAAGACMIVGVGMIAYGYRKLNRQAAKEISEAMSGSLGNWKNAK